MGHSLAHVPAAYRLPHSAPAYQRYWKGIERTGSLGVCGTWCSIEPRFYWWGHIDTLVGASLPAYCGEPVAHNDYFHFSVHAHNVGLNIVVHADTPVTIILSELIPRSPDGVSIERIVVEVTGCGPLTILDDLGAYEHGVVRAIDWVVCPYAKVFVTKVHSASIAHAITYTRWFIEANAVVHLSYGLSATSYEWISIALCGQRAKVQFNGAYACAAGVQGGLVSRQEHRAPHTTSQVVIRSALAAEGHGSYHGTIHVAEGANQSVAAQEHKTIVLANRARTVSIPSLEVLTDDVSCTHGSAVSSFEPDHLFYLAARGYTLKEAKKLLIAAFFADVVDNIIVSKRSEVKSHLMHVIR